MQGVVDQNNLKTKTCCAQNTNVRPQQAMTPVGVLEMQD